MKILGISGSLSDHSKTALAVQTALEHAGELHEEVDIALAALSDYDLVFCDGRDPANYKGDSRILLDKIAEADAYIIGSPIYRGTYTGALKNLFDLIPNDALEGKVVGIVATGGSAHHFLAIEHQFKPIFGFFNAHVIPSGVYANNAHFQDGKLTDESIINRLHKLGNETVTLSRKLEQPYEGPDRPHIEREALTES